jgi:GNAT superfamily N-acetyltransferase
LPLPSGGSAEVRELRAGEELAWVEVFAQAFLGRPPGAAAEQASLLALTSAAGSACFLAQSQGTTVGVALASAHAGVAILSGAGVLPSHRGRGLQLSLVRARLAWAAEMGLEVAAAATAAGTASQRTLERAGFRCAYPKAILVREV